MALDIKKIDLSALVPQEEPDESTMAAPLRPIMSEAIKVDPDQQVKLNNLSKQSGVPLQAVQDDPAEVETHLKLKSIDIDALQTNSPVTTKFLSDYNNAIIVHDDIDALAALETAATSVSDVVRAFPSGVSKGVGMAIEGFGTIYDITGRSLQQTLEAATPESMMHYVKKSDETPQFLKDIMELSGEYSPSKAFKWEGEELQRLADTLGVPKDRANYATDVSEALGQMGSQIAMWMVNPTLATTAMFAQGVEQQKQRQEKTDTYGEDAVSDTALVAGGAVTAVSEHMAIDKILNRIPPNIKNNIARKVTDVAIAGGIEAVQEVTENVGQGLIEMFTTNPDAEVFEGMGYEALVAGGAGAIARAIVMTAIPGKVGTFKDQDTIAQSQSSAEQIQIDKLAEAVENTKLKGRDAETFRKFVEGATDDSILLDSEQVTTYLQSKTQDEIESDAALKMLSKDIRETQITGADISIPVADFAEKVVGSPHYDALRPHMKLTPDAFTPFRAEEARAENQKYVESLMAEAEKNASEYVEAQDIFVAVRDQLVDTGRVTPQQAKVMAQVVPAWATAQAARRGVPVRQVYDEAGLTIEGPMTGKMQELSPEAMAQRQGFDTETVWLHGTSQEFDQVDLTQTPQRDAGFLGEGFYVTTDERIANQYAESSARKTGNDPQTKQFYIKPGNYKQYNLAEKTELANKIRSGELDPAKMAQDLMAEGYDGAEVVDAEGNVVERAVYNQDNIITTEEAEAREPEYKESSDVLAQAPLEPKLSALHNLSFENLIFADFIGGLAVPSIGVVKGDMGIEGYGEVTLIGTRDLADPGKMPVYDADAYTTTFPTPEYNNMPMKKADAMFAQFNDSFIKYEGNNYLITELYDYATKKGDPKEILYKLGRSDGVRAMFLNEITGTNIRPVIRDVKLRHDGVSDNPEVIKFMKNLPSDYVNYGAFDEKAIDIRKEFAPILERVVRNHYKLKKETVKSELANKRIDKAIESVIDDLTDEDGSVNFGMFDRILQDQKDIGKKEIDGFETSKKIDSRLKNKEIDFKVWLESKILPNFGDPYVRLGRKKVHYTLDNIVTKMTGEDVKAAEKTMTFSPGKARAAAARKFYSIESMRQFAPDDLGTVDEIRDAREKSEKVLEEYRTELSKYYTNTDWRGEIDIWNAMDDSMKVLAEWATNRVSKGSEKAFKNALRKNDFKNVPVDVIQRGIAAGESLLSAPVPYYEAKPLRAVQLNEFVGAAVPSKTPKEIIDILKKNDISIVKYGDRYDETARTNAVVKLRKKLSKNHDVLFQESRGYYDPQNSLIRLTESSDLSTFLHEFAHFMYDMELKSDGKMIDSIHPWFKRNSVGIAEEADGYSEGVSVGAGDVLAFYDNGTSGDTKRDSAIERAGHEWFARGFEAYLMEGKSPSMELRNVFRTIAQWLTQIYKAIRGNMEVNLDGEMRQVFDRLLATEAQIDAAKVRSRIEPLFTDAAMAGMTEEEFEKYNAQKAKAETKATETLRDKLIREMRRTSQKWWEVERSDIQDEREQELKETPVYRATESLKSGQFKLDHAAVKERFGVQKTDKLGRKSVRIPDQLRGMTATGGEGVHPDQAAAFYGFGSGDEMVQEILDAPKMKDLAASQAEQLMKEKYGDMLNDGSIEREADAALQNEERGKLILSELKALSKGTNRAQMDRMMLQSMAEENIGKMSFREINPAKYRRAEIKAAQAAATALAAGNKAEAANAKARQAMNFYLAKAADEAKTNTLKIVDGMGRYRKKAVQQNIQKAGNQYWEQLDKILSRFEFRKGASLKYVDKTNESLNVWMKNRIENDGDALVLDPTTLNESYVTHWKNIPHSELKGIADSVKNIEHVARYSNKIKMLEDERDFQQVVADWVDSMNTKVKSRFKTQRTDVAEGRSFGRWAMAQMTKIPYLASWLDGGERAGMSHDLLVKPFTDAYDAELKLWAEVGKPVMELIEGRSSDDIKRHNKKVFIPEIKTDNNDGNLYGHQILSVALNTGNKGNLKKMLLGEGWANPDDDATITFDNPRLQAVLQHMTKADWELVQQIWDQMDSLYPQLAEVHRRTTGLTPPKVESTPVQTPLGEFKGGYYPVKYDPERSFKAQEREDQLNAETESMFGKVGIQASVNASATNERTGYYAPIRLSLDVVPNHFQETIHYITHHDAVRQTNRLIRNESVAKTIREKLGPEEYAQLRPWLNDIAKDGREAPVKTFWGAALQRLRFGTTLGVMGFSASTGVVQILGLSNTVAEVGTANTLQAIRSILGSPETMASAWEFAVDNSKVMAHRMQTMDRDIKNAMQRVEGKKGVLAGVQEVSMKHIALMQTYMVDLPTWHAAYIKGMKEWGDEKRAYAYADWAVENIQGSGVTKDMSAIMRNQTQEAKMFTMFMTFFSSLWNMERDLVKGARSKTYSRTTVAAKAMFLFTIPVFAEMILKGEFAGEEDDDETYLQSYLTKLALYPVSSVPFARDIASSVIGPYGYNISPIAQLLESGTRGVSAASEAALTDKELTKGEVKGLSKLVGASLGVPGVSQVWRTGEHIEQVLEEGEDLTIKELLYGPER